MARLSCSPAAVAMIQRLVAVHGVDGERGGLRLSMSLTSRSLVMAIVPAPDPDDVVLALPGGQVFLDNYAQTRTEDMLLDSSRSAQADVFVLHEVADRRDRDEQTADRIRRFLSGR